MITVEALQEVYTALGGELTDTYEDIASGVAVSDYVTIPDVVAAIAEIVGSSGGKLPSVTSDDDGDILEVIDGVWTKVAASLLPSVTSDDEGKVLTVNDEGEWEVKELALTATVSDSDAIATGTAASGSYTAGTAFDITLDGSGLTSMNGGLHILSVKTQAGAGGFFWILGTSGGGSKIFNTIVSTTGITVNSFAVTSDTVATLNLTLSTNMGAVTVEIFNRLPNVSIS